MKRPSEKKELRSKQIAKKSKMNRKEMVVLGLDGGGTSTRCVCVALPRPDKPLVPVDKLQVLGEVSLKKSCNPNNVGVRKAHSTIKRVLCEALRKANKSKADVRAVCVGVSGVDTTSDKENMMKMLRTEYTGDEQLLYVLNDSAAALASGAEYGCVLISGTGVIAYGCTKSGLEAHDAGLGPLLGDKGSGFSIGIESVKAVLKAEIRDGPKTLLKDHVLKHAKVKQVDELLRWLYSDHEWANIATLAQFVFMCASEGDDVAQGIIDDAVEELAKYAISVAGKLSLGGPDANSYFPMVVVGGVMENAEGFAESVVARVQETYPKATLVKPKVIPAYGAAWLACKNERKMEN